MSKLIDTYISQNNVNEALAQCLRENQYHLGLLLAKFYQLSQSDGEFHNMYSKLDQAVRGLVTEGKEVVVQENVIDSLNPPLMEEEESQVEQVIKKDKKRVLLYCNWCDSQKICELWNKMSKGNYTWNNIHIVWEEPADYYVVINKPPNNIFLDTKKTILFHMEPHMDKNENIWGSYSKPDANSLFFCGTHALEYNNVEWHLSKNYTQLSNELIVKDDNKVKIISTVLSNKYYDIGQIKRIDFTKFLESKGLEVHVFGENKFEWKNYKGSLPYHNKDQAMFPYKYVFNTENNEIRNYFTEKLVDGILAECLVFYWGCPNIRELIDERAYVKLELQNFEQDFKTIMRAINENWWEQRLPYIKEAKNKILNDMQFFPRLEKILSN